MAQLTGLFTIGRDAETRTTNTGTEVVNVAVAYNYGRKDADNKKPSQWVRVAMFGKQAEALAPHLLKGKQVSLVIRDLHIATFQKQDGSSGTKLVARVLDVELGARQDAAPAPAPASRPAPPPQRQAPAPAPRGSTGSGFDDMDSDIPF